MPVVITLLNSYSGWALCAEGFILGKGLIGYYIIGYCITTIYYILYTIYYITHNILYN
jgi:NAD/NADP transhydrogenase beta subunit